MADISGYKVMAFHVRTTGLDFNSDDVIEFSSLVFEDGDVVMKDVYLDTDIEPDFEATAKNGYSVKELKEKSGGVSREDVLDDILSSVDSMCDDHLFVGMNLPFSLTMLLNNWSRYLEGDDRIDAVRERIRCFDVLVGDRVMRRSTDGGNRKLPSLSTVYGTMTSLDGSLVKEVRCIFEIAAAQMKSMFDGKDMDIDDIHAYMQKNALYQQKDLERYFERIGHSPVDYIGYPFYDTQNEVF